MAEFLSVEVRRGGAVREDLLYNYPTIRVTEMMQTKEERKIHRPDVRVSKRDKPGFVFMVGDWCGECRVYMNAKAVDEHNRSNGFEVGGTRSLTTF